MKLRALALAVVLLAPACGGDAADSKDGSGGRGALTGLFAVEPGRCQAGSPPAGSWFRLLRPDGSLTTGPFEANPDSDCADATFTMLRPGSDGGLRTGAYQPGAAEAFDGTGHATASRIVEPVRWSGFALGVSTNERDLQAKVTVAAPSLRADGRALSGDVRAIVIAWNGQHLNQGAPKPDGSRPGVTAGPRGAFDVASRTYALDWSSQILGGQYNNFTGVWHLEGTFRALDS